MAKYLVETYYNCTFKVSHYLDDINETNLSNLEKRDDGKFEILNVKLDNRKTKSLDKNSKNINIEKKDAKNIDLISKNLKKQPLEKEDKITFVKKINDTIGKRFSMPDRRKGYIQKATI